MKSSTILLACCFAASAGLRAQNWFPTAAPATSWTSLAASSDGRKLVASVDLGTIYVSGDGGASWTQASVPLARWAAVASSADGTNLAAVVRAVGGSIYLSGDAGATWTPASVPGYEWSSIASSADGRVLVAGSQGATVFVSTNSGASWQSHLQGGNWGWVGCSAPGDILAAVEDQLVYVSTNSGTTWFQATNAPALNWSGLVISTNGTTLVLAARGGFVSYVSTNTGASWVSRGLPDPNGGPIAGSGDAAILVMGAPGAVYTSTNQGLSWVAGNAPNNLTWSSVAASADGSTLLGVGNSQIYKSPPVSLPASSVVAWDVNNYGQASVPNAVGSALAVAGSAYDSVAVRTDGTVLAWGYNNIGQTNIPTNLTNVVNAAIWYSLSLALKSDGTVASWGNSQYSNTAATLTNITALAASQGDFYSALKSDGTVFSWGNNTYGQTMVPAGLSNVVAIAEGDSHCLALRNDGTIAAWGGNVSGTGGQTNIPAGLSNVVAVAAGDYFSLAVKTDGSIILFPTNYNSYASPVPSSLSNVVAVAANREHALALTQEGAVWEWGTVGTGNLTYRVGLPNVVAIACGAYHSLAIVGNGSPVIIRQPWNQTLYAGYSTTISAGVVGTPPLSFQWQANGTNVPGATNYVLTFTNVQPGIAGTYTLTTSNASGTASSFNAILTVLTNAPVITLQPNSQIIAVGSNVIFTARAGSGPIPVSYQWQWNATNIAGATTTALTLTNVQATNQGGYDLVVSNDYGSVTSSNATLAVVDLAAALNATNLVWTTSGSQVWFPEASVSHDAMAAASSGPVGNGKQAVIQTSVTGPGTLSFWWQVSGSGSYSVAFSVDGTNQVVLSSPTSWQQFTYYFSAGNHTVWWSCTQSIVNATVTAWLDQVSYAPGGTTPLFTTVPAGQTVPAGTNVTLRVSAAGTPTLKYQWQFGGANISGATGSSLSLTDVQSTNAGAYTLIVTNSFGSTNASLTLTVTSSPPVIWTQPANQEAVLGGACVFSASVRGSDPLSYQWLLNGSPVFGATNIVLTLNALRTNDIGNYGLLVTNAYGTITTSNAAITVVSSLLGAWGNNAFGQCTVPWSMTNVSGFAAGWDYSVAAGSNGQNTWGFPKAAFTPPPTGAVAFATGGTLTLALKADGTVVAAGTTVPAGLTNVVAIAAGYNSSLALRNDGSVAAWGDNTYGQTNVPPGLSNLTAIASGWMHGLALKSDGTVAAWGNNVYGQIAVPPGLSNVVAIAAGWYHSLAIRSDGSAVGWGYNFSGQSSIPAGLTNLVSIAGGYLQSMALRNDGTVALWGDASSGQTNIPVIVTNVMAISSGDQHCLALMSNGSPYAVRAPLGQSAMSGQTVFLNAGVVGAWPITYQWQFNGTNVAGGTNAVLVLTNVPLNAAGGYQCIASNAVGTITTASATLAVARSHLHFDATPGSMQSDGGFTLHLTGLSGHGAIILYASSNFVNWDPILTNLPVVGSAQFFDAATDQPQRFYRAIEQ